MDRLSIIFMVVGAAVGIFGIAYAIETIRAISN
jgi:hypothetical protein